MAGCKAVPMAAFQEVELFAPMVELKQISNSYSQYHCLQEGWVGLHLQKTAGSLDHWMACVQ